MGLLDTVTLRSGRIFSCHRGQALSATSHRPIRALHSSSRLKLGFLAEVELSLLSLSQKSRTALRTRKQGREGDFHTVTLPCQRYYPFFLAPLLQGWRMRGLFWGAELSTELCLNFPARSPTCALLCRQFHFKKLNHTPIPRRKQLKRSGSHLQEISPLSSAQTTRCEKRQPEG